MADFLPAFEGMIRDEGGYVLHDVPGDRGGMTYAGIARNMNPDWAGWALIDTKMNVPTALIREFYKVRFWDDMKGDQIQNQNIASSIFNFYVNTGRPAKTLAQLVVNVTPDGLFGSVTLSKLNAIDEEKFVMAYALAKIARYRDIVARNRTQIKFLMGWLNRTLAGVR
jgi:lysozyme family protein